MDQLPALGKKIGETVQPTFGIYAPLLIANEANIRSTTRKTFSFGPHPRQALDVYYPKTDGADVLVFFYGGGLVSGDKQIAAFKDGLAHSNVGHFFTEKFGLITIVADYRLISHGAKFPSGGEDVKLVVDWVHQNLSPRNLFMMGNSAGGIHLSTYLFASEFEESRKLHPIQGGIMLSVPYDFGNADPRRNEVLKTYYGDQVEQHCPNGLLQSGGSDVKLLVLWDELDPEDEILQPMENFLKICESKGMNPKVQEIKGHNHISPVVALGTGIEKEEAWGYLVWDFIKENKI